MSAAGAPTRPRTVNLNGTLLPAADARLSLQDHGLLYGLGVFETVRAYGGRLFRMPAHLSRLRDSAALLDVPVPWPDAVLEEAVLATLRADDQEDGAARLTVTRGVGPGAPSAAGGGCPSFFVQPRDWTPPARERFEAGYSATVARVRQFSGNPLARVKSLNFAVPFLARRDAAAKHADEALLLNERGEVVTGSIGNIFVVRDGELCTPPTAAGCLPGITRAVVLELARELDLPRAERALSLEELAAAREAFLTNSLVEVMPLVSLDGRPLGDGRPGPVTRRLAAAYARRVEQEVAGARAPRR